MFIVMSIENEPPNTCSLPTATPPDDAAIAGAVNGLDEIAKRQRLLFVIGIHEVENKLRSRVGAMGCWPRAGVS